ncbi:MAG: cyclodeaminase/cyclohydrolase family protein [Planctomycetes bacterium]|nr:cyclodeaminase/cyclohydrolase family protein [Planctomycetota bacterium]
MYAHGAVEKYLNDAAAKLPAPGGGSVSALAGALAAAMSEMSANFTTGKKKFADVQDRIVEMLAGLEACRRELVALVDEDVEAYGEVDGAYSMPKDTRQQKVERREAIQNALRTAMKAPLRVMEQCALVAKMADQLVEVGNPNLITDVGVSAILAEAACEAARLNVEINLKYIHDADVARDTRRRMDEWSRIARQCRERTTRAVLRYLAA